MISVGHGAPRKRIRLPNSPAHQIRSRMGNDKCVWVALIRFQKTRPLHE